MKWAPQLKDGDDGCSSTGTSALKVNYAHFWSSAERGVGMERSKDEWT